MSYEAFKPRVVWSDTGERFRIVQRREDRGEKPDEGTKEFPSAAIYVVEETTRRDAMGVSIWSQMSEPWDSSRALIYAIARDMLLVQRTLATQQKRLDETDRSTRRNAT